MKGPFRPFHNDNIPLVGQGFTVKGGFATVMVQCSCGANEPILLVGSTPQGCPACRKLFKVVEFSFDSTTGRIHTKVAQGMPESM